MPDAFGCDDELHRMYRDIADARSALVDARAAYNRSPNAERLAFRDMAELTMNESLERLHELVEAERIIRA